MAALSILTDILSIVEDFRVAGLHKLHKYSK